jgi:ribosomal protein L37AE/L43A
MKGYHPDDELVLEYGPYRERYPEVKRCRNPRCRDVIVGVWLCPSCALAGRWGAGTVAMVAGLLKLAGVL